MSTDEINYLPASEAIAMHQAAIDRESTFFSWWKKGVILAGYRFFGDGTAENLESAVNKNDLRPNSAKIISAFGRIGDSDAAFLTAMYCFFNQTRGAEISQQAGIRSVGDLTKMDKERREIISGLLVSYNGW